MIVLENSTVQNFHFLLECCKLVYYVNCPSVQSLTPLAQWWETIFIEHGPIRHIGVRAEQLHTSHSSSSFKAATKHFGISLHRVGYWMFWSQLLFSTACPSSDRRSPARSFRDWRSRSKLCLRRWDPQGLLRMFFEANFFLLYWNQLARSCTYFILVGYRNSKQKLIAPRPRFCSWFSSQADLNWVAQN